MPEAPEPYVPYNVFQQASTNTATAITSSNILRGSRKAKKLVVQGETNTIRYTMGSKANQVPLQNGNLGLTLAAGATITIEGEQAIETFRIISAALNTHGKINCIAYY